MPNIRIMNWNIETLSWTKASIAGMVEAIARTVASQAIDLLVLIEVRITDVARTMNAISRALNTAAPGAGGNDYKYWCLSYQTGGEYYGFIIRDLNVIRPVAVETGPTGSEADRITNLFANTFATKPGTFAAMANAYTSFGANPFPWQGPSLPLVDLFAGPAGSLRKRGRFSGATLAGGGYSLGRGYRAPCLAFFEVLAAAAAGGNTLLPIVVCHYMASQGPAAGQLAQLKDLHIAQHFANGDYINLNGAATLISELIFTGDFNVDFLAVDPAGSRRERMLARGYDALTPTVARGGSAAPAALPGAPNPVPGTPGGMTFPFVAAEYPQPESTTNILSLALRTAVTKESTHYKSLGAAAAPADLAGLRDHCYDNFIYGGTRVAAAARVPCPVGAPAPGIAQPATDSGLTVDLANNIRLSADPAIAGTLGLLDMRSVAQHYSNADTKGARGQPTLLAAFPAPPLVAPALTIADRWVGGRLLSDHLPTVIQLNLP